MNYYPEEDEYTKADAIHDELTDLSYKYKERLKETVSDYLNETTNFLETDGFEIYNKDSFVYFSNLDSKWHIDFEKSGEITDEKLFKIFDEEIMPKIKTDLVKGKIEAANFTLSDLKDYLINHFYAQIEDHLTYDLDYDDFQKVYKDLHGSFGRPIDDLMDDFQKSYGEIEVNNIERGNYILNALKGNIKLQLGGYIESKDVFATHHKFVVEVPFTEASEKLYKGKEFLLKKGDQLECNFKPVILDKDCVIKINYVWHTNKGKVIEKRDALTFQIDDNAKKRQKKRLENK